METKLYNTFSSSAVPTSSCTKIKSGSNANLAHSSRYRYLDKCAFTAIIIIVYVSTGMISSMFSPTMVDMKYMLGTSITKLAYINTFFGLGALVGSLFGFLLKYMDRHIAFIIFTLVQTIFALTPLASDIWMVYLCAFLARVGVMAFESGSYVWLISMWKHHYQPMCHLVHFSYSCGLFLAPFLDAPFVLGDVTKNSPYQSSLNESLRDIINYGIDRQSSLVIPFFIYGAITLLAPIGLFIMLFINKYDPDKEDSYSSEIELDTDEQSKTASDLQGSSCNYLLISLIAVSICIINGLAQGHVEYSPTYFQYLPIGITAQKASEILAVFSAFHALGRLVSIVEAMKVSATKMIMIHLGVACFAQILIFFGQYYEKMNWVGNALLGLGYSSMWTSYFNLTQEHIKLTETISALYLFSSQLLVILIPFLIGPIIEKFPEFFLYIESVLQIVIITLLITIILIIKKQKINI